jgi:hypothetical protein
MTQLMQPELIMVLAEHYGSQTVVSTTLYG